MNGIRGLREAVGWSVPATTLDWAAIEGAVGSRLPAEFKELCEAFPPGEFQSFLKVMHPAHFDTPAEFRAEITGYAALLSEAPRGVVPWATVGFDYVICWLPASGDPDTWQVLVCDRGLGKNYETGLGTAGFMHAITTVPTSLPVLSYVAAACQPPDFTPLDKSAGNADTRRPRPGYWLEGETPRPLAEPVEAVDDLRAVVPRNPMSDVNMSGVLRRMGRALPPDYFDLVAAFGRVTVGPATLNVPDDSATGFFAELDALAERIAAERATGGGPIGTIHPETDGLIVWGRLADGGYLCWLPESGNPDEWPVVVLDASLRMSTVHYVSASHFLLKLASVLR